MGVILCDAETDASIFDANFWHWRAIVEAVRALDVLPVERAELMHQPFVGELTELEARAVGAAIRERLLPTLHDEERLLLDGTRTTEPDDGVFHREPAEQHRNYGTTREILERFAAACETCHGFWIG